ncbi:MAG: phenylacetate--CoA ligase [Oscillospiraceae bacterium]|jgi:phenylacetate-CoA ligase|nr:phenylacetate--CoA ligase [Oscillospiraceae bacterium]
MYHYYNKDVECMPPEQLRQLQSERLKSVAERNYANVPFYKKKFDELGLSPADITGIDDVKKLPFTNKTDLRDNYPYGLFAVPMSDVVRIHASSGTTGKQTVVGYTRRDLDIWGEVMARTLGAGGVTKNDIGHISYGYGLFTGGLGGNIGSETIGCATIPASVGNTKRQITIMQDFKPTFILCTPSYALTLAEYIEDNGIAPESLSLKYGFFGAEPWTDAMKREIEAKLRLKAFDIYGLSEIIGPGVAYECEAHEGLHVAEDHFFIEIIDPDTGVEVEDGQYGEVVFTCLTKEALPLLRYRTHDISKKISAPCPCGRTSTRITKFAGRTDDMLIIRGVNVFPSQVEAVLLELGGLAPYYQLVVEREGSLDKLTVLVELTPKTVSGSGIKDLQRLQRTIAESIKSMLGLAVKVELVDPKAIERFEGKAVRVVDKRDKAFRAR